MLQQGHGHPGGAKAPSLETGRVLAGRYRITAFLGRGAVGEVYEAQDSELDEPVAVKVLRPEIAGDEQVLRRFKREVQLARRVTHPNVCRVFDLVYHPGDPDEGPADPRLFLTMELLRGETLSDRLERCGRMTMAEALPIVIQIARALEAAHANGVVHRDLKSGNVFLVDVPGGPRAVVTDFGLAGSTVPAGPVSAALTATGELIGSPAYMAPEQVLGEESTSATDIYALGIVLYEMVSGELPFVGKSAFYTALKRLQEPPPSPRQRVPELDPAWEQAILRCLERNPADRFPQARHVVRALGVTRLYEDATSPIALPPRRRSRLSFPGAAAGGAALLLGLALLFGIRTSQREPPQAAPASATPAGERAGSPRRAVAVLRFENLSKEEGAAYLGDALFQMLPTELAAAGDLRMIPVEEIDRAARDLGLSESGSLSAASLERLRSRLGADLVVTGAYLMTQAGGRTRFDLLAQDTRTGETVAVLNETGTEDDFLGDLASLGQRLRERLGSRGLSAAEAEAALASRPSTLEAARLYAEGLASLRRFEASRAHELLRQAVAADPGNPLLHSALGAAWSALGYDEPARIEARRAFELSTRLRREDRRYIEARYREAAQEWEPAVAIYRELADYFPENLEYGLRLASVQTASGAPAEALVTVGNLRRLTEAGRADPRLDLAEAEAALALADARQQRAASLRAERKGRALGARSLVAQALLHQGQAALALGEPGPALAQLTESARIYEAAGDRMGLGRAISVRGVALETRGDLAGAEADYRRMLEIYRTIGNQYGIAAATNSLGILHIHRRQLGEAREKLEQALAGFRKLGRKAAAANALNNLAAISDFEGDQKGFRARQEEVLAVYREIGDRSSEARTLDNLVRADFLAGELARALERAGSALRIYRELGDRSSTARTLESQGGVLLQSGDVETAEARFLEAQAIHRSLSEKPDLADSTLDLAVVALEKRDYRRAEERAREALGLFREVGLADRDAEVLAFLARCRLEQGQPGPAGEFIAQAKKAAATTGNLRFRLVLDVTEARVLAASGRAPEAIRMLEAAVREAREAGLVPSELEARLALGRAELAAGRTAAGRRRLDELAREARRRSFGLIATRAEGALAQRPTS